MSANTIFTFGGHYGWGGKKECPTKPFGGKYLLYQKEENGEYFFICDCMQKKHQRIVELWLQSSDKICGGGEMYFYGKERGFELTESSVKYGKVNHEITKKILQKVFKKVVVVIT